MILVLDTCSDHGIVSVVEPVNGSNATLFFHRELKLGFATSRHFFPAVEEALAAVEAQGKSIIKIVVAIGPGSYTGIRVGATAALTLAYSLEVELAIVTSLHGFFPVDSKERCEKREMIAAIDGRSGGVYCLFGGGKEPELLSWEAFAVMMQEKEPFIVSPTFISIEERIKKIDPTIVMRGEERSPDPLALYHYSSPFPLKEGGEFSSLPILYFRSSPVG